jgi:hypothetical protein
MAVYTANAAIDATATALIEQAGALGRECGQ